MTKVGKWNTEATFAEMRGNDEDAPTPAVRGTLVEPRQSTRSCHSLFLLDDLVDEVEHARRDG